MRLTTGRQEAESKEGVDPLWQGNYLYYEVRQVTLVFFFGLCKGWFSQGVGVNLSVGLGDSSSSSSSTSSSSSSSSAFSAISLRFTIFGEIFAYMTGVFLLFFNPTTHSVFVNGAHRVCFFMSVFTRLGRQYLLYPCDGMQVCTDYTSVYTLIRKSLGK